MKKMYDKSIYDIVLLTLKAIFISSCENIDSVVLNGMINQQEKVYLHIFFQSIFLKKALWILIWNL